MNFKVVNIVCFGNDNGFNCIDIVVIGVVRFKCGILCYVKVLL